MAGGGRGFAREGGRVWFVAGALPGELVEAEVERMRAGIVEARVVGVVRASPARASDACPAATRCGGCDLAHVAIAARPDILRQIVLGALRHARPSLGERVGQARVVVAAGERCRLRSRLHWDPVRRMLGFLGHRSHEVARIDPCRVISERLLGRLRELEGVLSEYGHRAGEFEWLEDLEGSAAVAGWTGAGGRVPEWQGVDGFWRLDRDGAGGDDGWGARGVTMSLPIPLFVPVGSFFQGNRGLVRLLSERVSSVVRGAGIPRVVDLYGGVGLFGAAAIAGGATDVTIVEASPASAAAARSNLPMARVAVTTCERFLADSVTGTESVAIVDPPRAGLSRPARDGLAAWGPERIVLVSCDAARFGRDADFLTESGYDLEELELWDLFPGTHHVEILSLFRRDGA
jgi:23S rRNA (uracil1939-C5)-methyltransferase